METRKKIKMVFLFFLFCEKEWNEFLPLDYHKMLSANETGEMNEEVWMI